MMADRRALTTNRSCEISGGAITFYLDRAWGPATSSPPEHYTAWQDDGRENANYAINYSSDGTNFYIWPAFV